MIFLQHWIFLWLYTLLNFIRKKREKTHRNPPQQRQWINYANQNSNEWAVGAVTFFCSFHTRTCRDKRAFHFIKRFAIFLIAILIFNLFTTRGSSCASWQKRREEGKKAGKMNVKFTRGTWKKEENLYIIFANRLFLVLVARILAFPTSLNCWFLASHSVTHRFFMHERDIFIRHFRRLPFFVRTYVN